MAGTARPDSSAVLARMVAVAAGPAVAAAVLALLSADAGLDLFVEVIAAEVLVLW